MSGGWGGGAWGGGPWGGSAAALIATPSLFDVFCFQDVTMYQIQADPNITLIGDTGPPSQFFANPVTLDFQVCSGGLFPLGDARVIATYNVPQSFTVEWVVKLQDLPNDFTDLVNNHIYLGCTDAAGPLVGLFLSKIGIAYTGSVSFPSGNLQLDTTFQVIPGSAAWVTDTDYLVIRAAADINLGFVYLYVTTLTDLPIVGQQLRAILPVIPYSAAATPPTDQSIVSVRGTGGSQTCAYFDSWCLGSSLIIPNLAPVANAGLDQAVRTCSIVQFDGSQSFDPEGVPVLYQWRLIDTPLGSEFAIEQSDGRTYPLAVPTGFTDKFHSTELGIIDTLDPIVVGTQGDVLMVGGVAYTLMAKGIDGNGFYVQIGTAILPEPQSNLQFKVLRQRGLSDPTTVSPTFYPDEPGFYSFDLTVFDGTLFSTPSQVIVNVLESPLPRGCIPDLSFIFNYLSDFWNLVEGRERLEVFWSSLAQTAATELFTLWQVEYSKSHRDIQRTFNRRWLHYDMLLGEPIPELTKMSAVFGGITSSFIPLAGSGGIYGTDLVISSPVLAEDVTITVRAQDPVTADILAGELRNSLQVNADARFTTSVVEDRVSGELAIRLEAPFPFTISSATTLPVFTAGDEARPPFGSGVGVGSRIYKVDRSLEGLGIEEDDFLVLDGVAYRIARITDAATDQFAFQRVVVKEDLPVVPAASWQVSGWVSSELLDFYNGLVNANDPVDFEASDLSAELAPAAANYELVSTICLGVNENLPGRMAVDFWPLGGALADDGQKVYLARVVRRRFVPLHEDVVDVPALQELIVIEDDQATLRRNVDYYLDTVRGRRCLRFVSGEVGDLADVWEGARPPDRLWAEYTYFDNSSLIEANFGIPVDLTIDQLEELPETVDYLSAVRGLWYAFFNGPSIRNIRIGVQILLGLPFAERKGVIEEIRTDFSPKNGRMLVRDADNAEIVRVYRWPKVLDLEVNPATGSTYAVGDTVEEFVPLVEGADVIDYISDPRWFEGIINQGIFYEVEKFHKFLVRVDSAAFNLSSLLFVRNFVLKIKPTYTFPLFVVRKDIEETEVSTTDLVQYHGTLLLSDAPCMNFLGISFHYDQPRPAGGGWRNQFDSDYDPNNAAPTFPTPDTVYWGFDKAYFCAPEDELVAICCETFGAPFTVLFDSCFAYDTPASLQYNDWDTTSIPASIPLGGYTIAYGAFGQADVNKSGTLTQIRFWIQGDPGSDPDDWEINILIDTGAGYNPFFTIPFIDGVNTEVVQAISYAVTAGDKLKAVVRPSSGAVSRSPNWSRISVAITQQDAVVWTFGAVLPAGEYCRESSV